MTIVPIHNMRTMIVLRFKVVDANGSAVWYGNMDECNRYIKENE